MLNEALQHERKLSQMEIWNCFKKEQRAPDMDKCKRLILLKLFRLVTKVTK